VSLLVGFVACAGDTASTSLHDGLRLLWQTEWDRVDRQLRFRGSVQDRSAMAWRSAYRPRNR